MPGKGSKRKGDTFERELAAYINKAVGLNSQRAPLSGGGSVFASGGADLIGTPGFFIEAKRVERLNFHDALRQVERNMEATDSDEMGVVINRKNNQNTGDSLCLLRLDDLLNLWGYYLDAHGFTPQDSKNDNGKHSPRAAIST